MGKIHHGRKARKRPKIPESSEGEAKAKVGKRDLMRLLVAVAESKA